MHPYISMELAQARRQDDLRRAERFRLAKQAKQARRAAERQEQPTLGWRLTRARRAAAVPVPTADPEWAPPTPLRPKAARPSSPRQPAAAEPDHHRRSA